jgi:hypothetical protein
LPGRETFRSEFDGEREVRGDSGIEVDGDALGDGFERTRQISFDPSRHRRERRLGRERLTRGS